MAKELLNYRIWYLYARTHFCARLYWLCWFLFQAKDAQKASITALLKSQIDKLEAEARGTTDGDNDAYKTEMEQERQKAQSNKRKSASSSTIDPQKASKYAASGLNPSVLSMMIENSDVDSNSDSASESDSSASERRSKKIKKDKKKKEKKNKSSSKKSKSEKKEKKEKGEKKSKHKRQKRRKDDKSGSSSSSESEGERWTGVNLPRTADIGWFVTVLSFLKSKLRMNVASSASCIMFSRQIIQRGTLYNYTYVN